MSHGSRNESSPNTPSRGRPESNGALSHPGAHPIGAHGEELIQPFPERCSETGPDPTPPLPTPAAITIADLVEHVRQGYEPAALITRHRIDAIEGKELALSLIASGQRCAVAHNLDIIPGLDGEVLAKLIQDPVSRSYVRENPSMLKMLPRELQLALTAGKRLLSLIDTSPGLDPTRAAIALIQCGYGLAVMESPLLRDRLDRGQIAMALIEAQQGWLVITLPHYFKGSLGKEAALACVRSERMYILEHNPSAFSGLDRDIATFLINSRQSSFVARNLSVFIPDQRQQIAIDICRAGDGAELDPYISELQDPSIQRTPSEARRALGALRISDLFFLSREQRLQVPKGQPTESQSREIWDRIKRSPSWSIPEGLDRLFERGAEEFGYGPMLRYVSASDVSRYDCLVALSSITELYRTLNTPEAYPEGTQHRTGRVRELFIRVLSQVAHDNARYEEGTSYHHLNSLVQGDIYTPKDLMHECENDPSLRSFTGLLNLCRGYTNPESLFASWASFRQFLKVSNLIRHDRQVFREIFALRGEARLVEADYFQQLACHKGSKPNIGAVIEMFRYPQRFLEAADLDGTPTAHEARKPSNYLTVPQLGLTAQEMVASFISGAVDRIQVLPPFEVRYEFPAEGKCSIRYVDTAPIPELLQTVLGARSRSITSKVLQGSAANRLAKELNDYLRQGLNGVRDCDMVNVTAIVIGNYNPSDNTALQLRAIIRSALQREGRIDEHPVQFVARVAAKSDPVALLAGNDTANCMQFGSGKTTSYMFNPSCVPFLVERLDSAASRRTVAHSLLTVTLDLGIGVPQVMPCLDGTIKELPGGVEFGPNRFLVCDSIDYNENYFSTPSQALVLQQVYEDFMFRYLQALPQAHADGRPIATDRVLISESYPGPFAVSSLSAEPNRFVPLAPLTYSDNLGARCYTLVPKPSLQPLSHGALPPFAAASPGEWQPITELTYRDTLPVSLIEGNAYGDEPELPESVSARSNILIAKDIANSARSLPNLSLKYVSSMGEVRGYIIAYEGHPDSSVQHALRELGLPDNRILYVENFASINRKQGEGGKLLLEFCNRFHDYYVTKGDMVPLFVEAREETIFALLKKQLPRIADRLGKKLVLTPLGEFRKGHARMHRLLITPAL